MGRFSKMASIFLMGSLFLMSCSNKRQEFGEDFTNDQMQEIYDSYTEDAQSKGETPLSYEAWLESIKGEKGDKGDPGASVVSVQKTDTEGNVDTYTITFSDGTVTTYQVTNGVDGHDGEDGHDGHDGASFLQGTELPESSLGKDGDTYFCSTNYKIYYKENGEWVEKCSIEGVEGQQGPQGLQGQQGPQGPSGSDGSSVTSAYINSDGELILVFEGGSEINAGRVANLDGHIHTFENEFVNSTCTENGYVRLTCTTCGFTSVSTIPASGHNYGEWKETSPATCTHTGEKTRFCAICGARETEIIEAHDHNWTTSYVYNGSEHWEYCLSCGVMHNCEAHDHNGQDGTCSVCHYVFPIQPLTPSTIDGFTFADNGDGTYAIIDYSDETTTEVIIPESYNNRPVSSFGKIFKDNQTITSVYIPDSIVSLAPESFRGCINLKTVRLPSELYDLPSNVFNGCYNLETINLPSNLKTIGQNVFYDCYKLKITSLPEAITTIPNSAFYNCQSIENFYIGSNVTSIEWYAFANCRKLNNLIIPKSVNYIAGYAFYDCSMLDYVTFEDPTHWGCDEKIYPELLSDPNRAAILLTTKYCEQSWCYSNIYYTLSSDQTYYLAYLSNRDHSFENIWELDGEYNNLPVRIGDDCFREVKAKSIILNNISFINGWAFSYSLVEEVTFNNCSNLNVGSYAFYYCSNLKKINMNNSNYDFLGNNCFYNCTALEKIVLNGNETINSYCFGSCDNLTIYLRSSSVGPNYSYNWNNSNCPVVYNYDGE